VRQTLESQRVLDTAVIHRLAYSASWSLIGILSSQALALLSTIMVARFVGREGYGEIGMIQSTLGMLGVLAGFGLGSTTTKYVAEFRLKSPERVAGILSMTTLASLCSGLVLASLCVVLAPPLVNSVMNREALLPLLQAGALLLLISTLGGVQKAALSGFEAFRRIAVINILQGVAAPLVTIPCVWFFGVAGAIAALTITAAIGLLLCTAGLNQECKAYAISRNLGTVSSSDWPLLWEFALPSMLSALMVTPVTWLTNSILVNQANGYSELGLFNAANQWRALILYVPAVFGPALLPILSETYSRADRANFREAVCLSLRVTWLFALPITIIVLGGADPLAKLFGKQFSGASSMISISALACFLTVVNGAVGTALAGSGRMWTGMLMNAGWAMILIAAAILLIPSLGGRGLAIAYLVAYLFHTVWVMIYVDLKLAPSAIREQWRLIVFSVVILAASFELSLRDRGAFLYQCILFLIALVPLLRMAKSQFWTPA
jgi:O-antigen/teichoic acid export membrane protein